MHGLLCAKRAAGLVAGLRAAVASLDRALTDLLSKAWPSYALVAALQTKILWDAWLYCDLTSGDTSSYYVKYAYPWYDRFADNIVWSPLYTSFYGSVLMLTGGHVYAATILHRITIAMVATLGVVAVARRLLPSAIALLVAIWWAVLPINFNTLYEVHLFGLLPVLAAWLVAMSGTAWSRGIALATLMAATVLVRNELIVATALYGVACLVREIAANRHGGASVSGDWSNCVVKYSVPLLVAMAVCLVFYWRSDAKYPQINVLAEEKHGLNMCQVYAFGYSQRHPDWTLSPWTQCEGLMVETFGKAWPSLREMIASNPRAVLVHFIWNFSLVPNGFQVALFNAMSGTVNPDYAPVTRSQTALNLSLVALLVVVSGAAIASREQELWRAWLRERADAWTILFSVFCVAGPIILTQRPRPSYLFASTFALMVIIGSALHVLTDRMRFAMGLRILSVAGGLALLVVVPPYYPHRSSGRPLYTNFEILEPFARSLRETESRIMIGDYNSELANYLQLRGDSTLDYGILAAWDRYEELSDFLARSGIDVVYLQPRMMKELRAEPHAQELLSEPESQCWQRLGQETTENGEWLLLRRTCARGSRS